MNDEIISIHKEIDDRESNDKDGDEIREKYKKKNKNNKIVNVRAIIMLKKDKKTSNDIIAIIALTNPSW